MLGETVLARVLDSETRSDHRRGIAALRRLEERTRDVLQALVDRHAVTVDLGTARAAGDEFGERVSTMPWDEFMRRTGEIATEALPRFRELVW